MFVLGGAGKDTDSKRKGLARWDISHLTAKKPTTLHANQRPLGHSTMESLIYQL